MNVGFSGTQRGMTDRQKYAVEVLLQDIPSITDFALTLPHFNYGLCVGADDEAADLARRLGYTLVAYPGENMNKRGKVEPDEWYALPKSYLARNHEIVDTSDVMIFAPRQMQMVLRSGTWATIRYAIRKNKPMHVVKPDGDVITKLEL